MAKSTVRRGRENRPNEVKKALMELGGLNAEAALKEIEKAQKENDADAHLTDKEIEARLNSRFDIIAKITKSTLLGTIRSVIVSGPEIGRAHV